MIIKKVVEDVFGSPVSGIEIRLTSDESQLLVKMIKQGFLHPPQIGLNTDYKAKELGGQVVRQIEELTR